MTIRYIIFFLIIVLFSCSNARKSRKSGSNFLAYYNSFYMAEKSFEQAIKEIESMDEIDGDIPSKAKNLLNDAIENALIIENQFNQTKYIDDAYFILGKSSFLIDRLTSSKYYFNRLIKDFPNSEYLDEVMIWLNYIDFEIGYYEKVKSSLLLFDAKYNKMKKNEKYLIDLLSAKLSNYYGNIKEEKKHYLLAIDNSSTKSQKIFLYKKILYISESEEDYLESVSCIDNIEKYSEKNINIDLIEKWIVYNRLLGNFDQVIKKINEKIEMETSDNDIIYYYIEKSKTFIEQNEIDKSINTLNDIISKYDENDRYKNKLGEAYLLLGKIYLSYFNNTELAKQKLEKCKEISSSTSIVNKQSKKYIEAIIDFESFNFEIENFIEEEESDEEIIEESDVQNNLFMPLMPADLNNPVELDSLMFKAAQLLYFDLGMEDSAVVRFEEIIDVFPLSLYGYKSLIVLDLYSQDKKFSNEIENHPFNLNFSKIDNSNEQSLKIKKALDLISINPESAAENLLDLNSKYDDSESLYLAGYIYDNFLNDISEAVRIYRDYLDKYNDGEYISTINLKISKIENMINDEIDFLNQKINYRNGWRWINKNLDSDSAIYYFDLTSGGPILPLKSYSELLSSSIKRYHQNNMMLKNNDEVASNIDSIKLNVAHFLYKDLHFDIDASKYYKEIVNNSQVLNYIQSSLAALSNIEPEEKWDSTLFSMLNDSTLYNIQLNNSLKNDLYKIDGTSYSDSLNFLWYNKLNTDLFPEIIEESDSVKNNQEHNQVLNNIKNAQKDIE